MKKAFKIIFTAIAIIGFSFYSHAQENKIGFKAGLNLSNFHGDDVKDTKMKMGFHVGGFATMVFGNIAFQPELLISTRGAKHDTEEDDVEESTNLMYVDIPLLLKFYLTENVNIHAGPQVGILLSAKEKIDPEPDNYDGDISEFTQTLDVGALAGLEFDTEMGLVVGARYFYGFTSIQKDYETESTVNGVTIKQEFEAKDVKNSMIQIYVGLGF